MSNLPKPVCKKSATSQRDSVHGCDFLDFKSLARIDLQCQGLVCNMSKWVNLTEDICCLHRWRAYDSCCVLGNKRKVRTWHGLINNRVGYATVCVIRRWARNSARSRHNCVQTRLRLHRYTVATFDSKPSTHVYRSWSWGYIKICNRWPQLISTTFSWKFVQNACATQDVCCYGARKTQICKIE